MWVRTSSSASAEPVRRGHGAVYGGLNHGRAATWRGAGHLSRPDGRAKAAVNRSYSLNPAVAGYESEEDFVREMTRQLAVGGPPPILVPEYQTAPPRRGTQLHSVA